ncbi:putative pyridoxal kinase, partial [Stegodyphus mimosarum]
MKGQLLNANELQELYDGLKLNDIHHYTHILTGYVGTVTFLTKLVEIVKE